MSYIEQFSKLPGERWADTVKFLLYGGPGNLATVCHLQMVGRGLSSDWIMARVIMDYLFARVMDTIFCHGRYGGSRRMVVETSNAAFRSHRQRLKYFRVRRPIRAFAVGFARKCQ